MVHRQYSEELKQRLVGEIEAGRVSVREAARDVGTPVTMVRRWLRDYGRYQPQREIVEVVMKSEQEKIAALEKALADAHLRLHVYDELIAQASQHYGTDLKKSFGTPSPTPVAPPDARWRPSAPFSDGPATRTTNARDVARPRDKPPR